MLKVQFIKDNKKGYFPGYKVMLDGKYIGDVVRTSRRRMTWDAYTPFASLPLLASFSKRKDAASVLVLKETGERPQ